MLTNELNKTIDMVEKSNCGINTLKVGIEPTTRWLTATCSTTELLKICICNNYTTQYRLFTICLN
jgi:hypothetical protein